MYNISNVHLVADNVNLGVMSYGCERKEGDILEIMIHILILSQTLYTKQ